MGVLFEYVWIWLLSLNFYIHPENRPYLKRKGSFPKHHVSGAFAVSFRECFLNWMGGQHIQLTMARGFSGEVGGFCVEPLWKAQGLLGSRWPGFPIALFGYRPSCISALSALQGVAIGLHFSAGIACNQYVIKLGNHLPPAHFLAWGQLAPLSTEEWRQRSAAVLGYHDTQLVVLKCGSKSKGHDHPSPTHPPHPTQLRSIIHVSQSEEPLYCSCQNILQSQLDSPSEYYLCESDKMVGVF